MEYQTSSRVNSLINPFESNFINFNDEHFENQYEKCPLMPVEIRLQQNK